MTTFATGALEHAAMPLWDAPLGDMPLLDTPLAQGVP